MPEPEHRKGNRDMPIQPARPGRMIFISLLVLMTIAFAKLWSTPSQSPLDSCTIALSTVREDGDVFAIERMECEPKVASGEIHLWTSVDGIWTEISTYSGPLILRESRTLLSENTDIVCLFVDDRVNQVSRNTCVHVAQ